VLNACASVLVLEEGRRAHEQIIRSSCESDVFVGSSLVDMYAKCGSMEDAERVFHKVPSTNVVLWNTMISGHVKCGQGEKALELFGQMQQKGVQPDPVTLVTVLNACVNVAALEEGRCAHEQRACVLIVCGTQMSFWVVAWLTCMQNVGTCRMHAECSIGCLCVMWSLGM